MATHKSSPYLFTGVKRVVRQIGTLQASDYQALTLAQFNSYARGGGALGKLASLRSQIG